MCPSCVPPPILPAKESHFCTKQMFPRSFPEFFQNEDVGKCFPKSFPVPGAWGIVGVRPHGTLTKRRYIPY